MSGYGSRFQEWFSGSYHELAIELSLAPSDIRLAAAVDALVEHGLDRVLYDAPEFTAPLDHAFAEIGARIFTRAGFELGIIGEETSGKYSSTSFGETDLPFTGFLLPEPLWGRVEAVSAASETIAPGLKWIAPKPA